MRRRNSSRCSVPSLFKSICLMTWPILDACQHGEAKCFGCLFHFILLLGSGITAFLCQSESLFFGCSDASLSIQGVSLLNKRILECLFDGNLCTSIAQWESGRLDLLVVGSNPT